MNEAAILDGMTEALRQGEALLRALDDTAYTTRLPAVFDASVGGHYRHVLDHFQGLLDALDADDLDYDQRRRDARIENDRSFAMAETRRLRAGCETIPAELLDREILVRTKVSYAGDEAQAMPSSIGREAMYVVGHTIHHYALIGVMCHLMKLSLPAGFGVAPSTLKHLAETRAALVR